MDYYLVNKLQEIKRNPRAFIPDVSFLYSMFRLPPTNISDIPYITLVPDKLKNFTRILLVDTDFDILFMMVLIFTALDALGLDIVVSGIIFYVFYRYCILAPKKMLGEWNLSRTSGIDSKFLI